MRSPRPRAATGRAGCPSPTSSRRGLRGAPSIECDLHQLVDCGLELLLTAALEALPQDRDDLASRAPVDEDDEAESEALLIGAVQVGELREHDGVVVAALFDRRPRRGSSTADGRVRVEHLLLLVVREAARDLARVREGILDRREPLDEPCPTFEQLCELLDAQLPR